MYIIDVVQCKYISQTEDPALYEQIRDIDINLVYKEIYKGYWVTNLSSKHLLILTGAQGLESSEDVSKIASLFIDGLIAGAASK